MQPSQPRIDLLVVGAGPTGLTAALEARRFGLSVRIVDKRVSRALRSKALIVHARTMEILENLGLEKEVAERGLRFTAINLTGTAWAQDRLVLGDLDWGDTKYPFWMSLPQYETEQVFEKALDKEGVQVEWASEVTGLSCDEDGAVATVQGRDGRATIAARWVIGADGSHSAVRGFIGGNLDRIDDGATLILADIHAFDRSLPQDEGHIFLHPRGLLIAVPMPEQGLWRIFAHRPGESANNRTPIDLPLLEKLVRNRTGLEGGMYNLGWTSRFALIHGISDVIRLGRVVLAGDAVHVHSPVGGQGHNTGIQDAHNLIWKLAAADRLGEGPEAQWLLDSYVSERRKVAEEMVGAVERATTMITRRSSLARFFTGAVVPRVIFRGRRRQVFARMISGLDIAYGGEAGGRRVPNHPTADAAGVHSHLDPGGFTWVVNQADADGPWHGLPVLQVQEGPAVTLVRPDGYVAASGESVEDVIARIHPALWAAALALAD